MRLNLSLLPTTCLFACSFALSQQVDTAFVTFPTVVVTANRVPIGSLHVNRFIHVINESHIRAMSAYSIEDVLGAFSVVDLQPRGPFGVQTDMSIRGSLFSQNLILLNGNRLNDPQTAHHNFDLPFSLDQIGKIEIMKGPGSALYGPDAFAGVINILTKEPSEGSGRLKLSGGEYGFRSIMGSFALSASGWRVSNSAEYRRSSGYRDDTDFEIWSASSNHSLDLLGSTYSLLLGYTKKRFGAFDFYSPGRNVPSKEWTSSGYASLITRYLVSSVLVEPSVFYRRHDDKFMFDLRTPDQFVNTHGTDLFGGRVLGTVRLGEGGVVTGGVENAADQIKSSRLGNHSKSLTSVFMNTNFVIAPGMNLDGGARYDISSTYASQLNPTFGLGISPTDEIKFFAYVARSFREPSYTDLYYSDPANEGNPNLQPETGWSYELGGQWRLSDVLVSSGSIFLRKQENLIDYVQFAPQEKFYAVNLTAASIDGADVSLEWSNAIQTGEQDNFHFKGLLIQYSFVQSRMDRGRVFNSKYSLTHPKHQISAYIGVKTPLSIEGNLSAEYKYRSSDRDYMLLNLSLSNDFGPVALFLNAKNVLNVHYEEIIGVPQPGRWIVGGLELKVPS